MKILFVCHDAGAANVISAFITNIVNTNIIPVVVVSGPAEEIFRKKHININYVLKSNSDYRDCLYVWDNISPECLITGTSHSAMPERHFIGIAEEKNIYSLSYIDWWANYSLRFSTPETLDLKYLPNRVIVSDIHAFNGCKAEKIPECQILIAGNPHWENIIKSYSSDHISEVKTEIRNKLAITEDEILVVAVSGILRNLNLNLGFDENDFWRVLKPIPLINHNNKKIRWHIIKHPSEPLSDLEKLISGLESKIYFDSSFDAWNLIIGSDYVVGMISTLLFEALIIGKPVMSIVPNAEFKKLPFTEIFQKYGITVLSHENDTRNQFIEFVSSEKNNSKSAFPDIETLCTSESVNTVLKDVFSNISDNK